MNWLLIGLVAFALWKWFSLFVFPAIIRRWFSLEHRLTAAEGYLAVPDRSGLLGRVATAQTDLRPSGKITIDAERLDASSRGEFIPRGARVVVIEVRGVDLIVGVPTDP